MGREQPQAAPGSAAEVRDVGLLSRRASEAFWLCCPAPTAAQRARLPEPSRAPAAFIGGQEGCGCLRGLRLFVVEQGELGFKHMTGSCGKSLPSCLHLVLAEDHTHKKFLLSQPLPEVCFIYRAEILEKSADVRLLWYFRHSPSWCVFSVSDQVSSLLTQLSDPSHKPAVFKGRTEPQIAWADCLPLTSCCVSFAHLCLEPSYLCGNTGIQP